MINVHSEEYILGQNIRNCRMKKKWTQKQKANFQPTQLS